jgi:2-polyprenyl-3-methyl-5-hydroxy-6-metoxy-1,4-benzoquinol methylase
MDVRVTIETLADLRELEGEPPALADHPACPLCGSAEGTDVAEIRGTLRTRWCHGCSHVFRSRRPDDDWFRDWYGSSWDAPAAAGRVGTMLAAARLARAARSPETGFGEPLQFCRPVVQRGTRVLDVGCGLGATLRTFRRAGCEVFGIEPSPHRAAVARRLGAQVGDVGVEDLDADAFGGPVDLVLTNHVLEHVVDVDRYVERVASVLKPSGHLYIAVPNAHNDFLLQHAFYALHVHLFARSSLERVLRRAGFEPQRVAEDHQLRILARYEPDRAGEEVRPPVGGPPEERVLERLVGAGWHDRAGDTIHCKWSVVPVPRMLREPYAVEWSPRREPMRERQVSLRIDADGGLPVVFSGRDAGEPTPFWVK